MLTIRSFDSTIISPKIEIPRIEEILLSFPFCKTAAFENLHSNGPSDLRNLLDQVPLMNNHKYITVNMEVQLLLPELTAAPRSNWHFDAMSFRPEEESNCHLLVSECYSRTEFLDQEIYLSEYDEDSSPLDVEIYMNKNLDLVTPRKMPSNRFITFSDIHLHRPVRADRTEFRFMLRVLESDYLKPRKYAAALMNSTTVFNDNLYDYSGIDSNYVMSNESEQHVTIERYSENKITLNFVGRGE